MKQSTHPYNGQMPRDQSRDPNRTRPPYWPTGMYIALKCALPLRVRSSNMARFFPDVGHKEPDHITKEGEPRGSMQHEGDTNFGQIEFSFWST